VCGGRFGGIRGGGGSGEWCKDFGVEKVVGGELLGLGWGDDVELCIAGVTVWGSHNERTP
jgi:hypothetical protein